ncbi:MAG: hypothetical protein IPO21_00860 [Bacteroidales bacterium]|nr:hypothetical protein [Bacteroidales bacterium]
MNIYTYIYFCFYDTFLRLRKNDIPATNGIHMMSLLLGMNTMILFLALDIKFMHLFYNVLKIGKYGGGLFIVFFYVLNFFLLYYNKKYEKIYQEYHGKYKHQKAISIIVSIVLSIEAFGGFIFYFIIRYPEKFF